MYNSTDIQGRRIAIVRPCALRRTVCSPCSKSPNGAKLPLVGSQSACVCVQYKSAIYVSYTCDNTCYPESVCILYTVHKHKLAKRILSARWCIRYEWGEDICFKTKKCVFGVNIRLNLSAPSVQVWVHVSILRNRYAAPVVAGIMVTYVCYIIQVYV